MLVPNFYSVQKQLENRCTVVLSPNIQQFKTFVTTGHLSLTMEKISRYRCRYVCRSEFLLHNISEKVRQLTDALFSDFRFL